MGVSVRARVAQHADRDPARRQARRSIRETASQTYYACLLSHAGCTTDAHVTPRGLRRFADDSSPPGHVRVGTRGPLRAHPRAARPRQRGARARRSRSRAGCRRLAREQRPHLTAMCEVAGMLADEARRFRRRWQGSSPTSPSAGTAGDRSVVRRGRRSRCRCGSSTSPSTPRSSVCWAARTTPCASSATAQGTRSIRRSRPAWPTVPRRFSRSTSTRRHGTRRSPASRADRSCSRATSSIARSPRWATSPT